MALIQCDWCSYWQRSAHTQRQVRLRTQEGGRPCAKERRLQRNVPMNSLISGFWLPAVRGPVYTAEALSGTSLQCLLSTGSPLSSQRGLDFFPSHCLCSSPGGLSLLVLGRSHICWSCPKVKGKAYTFLANFKAFPPSQGWPLKGGLLRLFLPGLGDSDFRVAILGLPQLL